MTASRERSIRQPKRRKGLDTGPVGRTDFLLPPTKVADPDLVASRRERIVSVATRLFAEKGFNKTSISDLSKAAGIPIGTLYLYIEKKEDLLVLMAASMLGEIEAALDRVAEDTNNPGQQLVLSIAVLFREMERYRRVVKIMYWETHQLDRLAREPVLGSERRATAHLTEIISRGIDQGVFRNVDARVLAHDVFIAAHMWALKHWAFNGDYGLTLDDYIERQTDIILGALGVPHQIGSNESAEA